MQRRFALRRGIDGWRQQRQRQQRQLHVRQLWMVDRGVRHAAVSVRLPRRGDLLGHLRPGLYCQLRGYHELHARREWGRCEAELRRSRELRLSGDRRRHGDLPRKRHLHRLLRQQLPSQLQLGCDLSIAVRPRCRHDGGRGWDVSRHHPVTSTSPSPLQIISSAIRYALLIDRGSSSKRRPPGPRRRTCSRPAERAPDRGRRRRRRRRTGWPRRWTCKSRDPRRRRPSSRTSRHPRSCSHTRRPPGRDMKPRPASGCRRSGHRRRSGHPASDIGRRPRW